MSEIDKNIFRKDARIDLAKRIPNANRKKLIELSGVSGRTITDFLKNPQEDRKYNTLISLHNACEQLGHELIGEKA